MIDRLVELVKSTVGVATVKDATNSIEEEYNESYITNFNKKVDNEIAQIKAASNVGHFIIQRMSLTSKEIKGLVDKRDGNKTTSEERGIINSSIDVLSSLRVCYTNYSSELAQIS